MNTVELPPAIQQFIDATNAADDAAFLDAFSKESVLEDWGRVFVGRDGIAAWNRSDNIGVRSQFRVLAVDSHPEAGTYVVTVRVSGDGYNGTSPIEFLLRADKIARLIIAQG